MPEDELELLESCNAFSITRVTFLKIRLLEALFFSFLLPDFFPITFSFQRAKNKPLRVNTLQLGLSTRIMDVPHQ